MNENALAQSSHSNHCEVKKAGVEGDKGKSFKKFLSFNGGESETVKVATHLAIFLYPAIIFAMFYFNIPALMFVIIGYSLLLGFLSKSSAKPKVEEADCKK